MIRVCSQSVDIWFTRLFKTNTVRKPSYANIVGLSSELSSRTHVDQLWLLLKRYPIAGLDFLYSHQDPRAENCQTLGLQMLLGGVKDRLSDPQ